MENTKQQKVKTNRSYYITEDTRNLVRKVTTLISLQDQNYTQDDAIQDAFKLLAHSKGLDKSLIQ